MADQRQHRGPHEAIASFLNSAFQKEALFGSLCLSLEANDPDTTVVVMPSSENQTDSAHLTDDRAVRLGLALRGNSNLVSLSLGVDHVDSVSSVVGIAHYINAARSLKTFKIVGPCNSSCSRTVAVVDRLLAACSFNSSIQELVVPAAFGAHPLALCLSSQRNTLRSLTLTVPTNVTLFDLQEKQPLWRKASAPCRVW